ncbi:MAG: peptidoglycan-binding protein [Clostridia bacterium]|jgi:peptidoglycan hydrolase-like protein with peptidoglycan-binding domain|nr:peptidoglycan-binding protein [Clostridia bacterium]
MKSNPKTLVGVILLVVLAIALGFLLSRMIPTIGEVQREKSLTPTPLPDIPANVMEVTPDPAGPTPEPVLRTGSRGEDVKTLQGRLHDLGYYTDEIDGQFGAATKAAVIEFQQANGLDADGMVGSETKTLLYSVNAKPKGSN